MSLKVEFYDPIGHLSFISSGFNIQSQISQIKTILELCLELGLCDEKWRLQFFPEEAPLSNGIDEIINQKVSFENGKKFTSKNIIDDLLFYLPPIRFEIYLRGSSAALSCEFLRQFDHLIESFVAKSPVERAPLLRALIAFQQARPKPKPPSDLDWLFLPSKDIDTHTICQRMREFGENHLGGNCYAKIVAPTPHRFASQMDNVVLAAMKSNPKIDLVIGRPRYFSLSHADDFYIPIRSPRSAESKGTDFWQAVFCRTLKIFNLEKRHSNDFYSLLGAIQRITEGYLIIEEEGASLSQYLKLYIEEPLEPVIDKIMNRIDNHSVDPFRFLFNFCIHIPIELPELREKVWSIALKRFTSKQLGPFSFLNEKRIPFAIFSSELNRFWVPQGEQHFVFPVSFTPLEERFPPLIDHFKKMLLFKFDCKTWIEHQEYGRFACDCLSLKNKTPNEDFLSDLLKGLTNGRFNQEEKKKLLKELSPENGESLSLNQLIDHLAISTYASIALPFWESSGGCEKNRLETLLGTPGLSEAMKKTLLQISFKTLSDEEILASLHRLFRKGLVERTLLFELLSGILTSSLLQKILSLKWDPGFDQEILRLFNQSIDNGNRDKAIVHTYVETLPEKNVPLADKIRLIWKTKELEIFPYTFSKIAAEMEVKAIQEVPSAEFIRMVENLIDRGQFNKMFQLLPLIAKEHKKRLYSKLTSYFSKNETLNSMEYYPRLIVEMGEITPEVVQLYKSLLFKNTLSERLRVIQAIERNIPHALQTPLLAPLLLDKELFAEEEAKLALCRLLKREMNDMNALQLLWKIEKQNYLPEPKEIKSVRERIYKCKGLEIPIAIVQEELDYLREAKEIRKFLDLLTLLQNSSNGFKVHEEMQKCLNGLKSLKEAVQFFSHPSLRKAPSDSLQISLNRIDTFLDQAIDDSGFLMAFTFLSIPYVVRLYEPHLFDRICKVLSQINLNHGKWLNLLQNLNPNPLDLQAARSILYSLEIGGISMENPRNFIFQWRKYLEDAFADDPKMLLRWYLILYFYKIELPASTTNSFYLYLKEKLADLTFQEFSIALHFFKRSPQFLSETLSLILEKVEAFSKESLFEELIPFILEKKTLYIPKSIALLRKLARQLLELNSVNEHACQIMQAYSSNAELNNGDCEFILKKINPQNFDSVNWRNILNLNWPLKTLKMISEEIINKWMIFFDSDLIEMCAFKLMRFNDLSPFLHHKKILKAHFKNRSDFENAVKIQVKWLLNSNELSETRFKLISKWIKNHVDIFALDLMEFLVRTPKKIHHQHMTLFKIVLSIQDETIRKLLLEETFQNHIVKFIFSDFYNKLMSSGDEFAFATACMICSSELNIKSKTALLNYLLDQSNTEQKKQVITLGLFYLLDYPNASAEIIEKILLNVWNYSEESLSQCVSMIDTHKRWTQDWLYKKRPLLQQLILSIKLKEKGQGVIAEDVVSYIDGMLSLKTNIPVESIESVFLHAITVLSSDVKNEVNLFKYYFYSYLSCCFTDIYKPNQNIGEMIESYIAKFKSASKERHLNCSLQLEKLINTILIFVDPTMCSEFSTKVALIIEHIKTIYKLPNARYYKTYFENFIIQFLAADMLLPEHRTEICQLHRELYIKDLVQIKHIYYQK